MYVTFVTLCHIMSHVVHNLLVCFSHLDQWTPRTQHLLVFHRTQCRWNLCQNLVWQSAKVADPLKKIKNKRNREKCSRCAYDDHGFHHSMSG